MKQSSLVSICQFAYRHTQRGRNTSHNGDCRITHEPLHPRNVSAVHAGLVGQLLLGPASLAPELAHIVGEPLANFHARIGHRRILSDYRL